MASSEGPKFIEGRINFTHDGETYKTYYKRFGELENRTRNPLVVLHGGPGLCHDYLVSFSHLTEVYGIPVILYDQLGNGKSTHLKQNPPTFWTLDLFIDELVNLLNHFDIQDGFDLAGHSWGGILASEFEVRRQPAGLKHLILASSLATSSLWNQSNGQLMQGFPDDVKQSLMSGMKEPEKFFHTLKEFHSFMAVSFALFQPHIDIPWIKYSAQMETLLSLLLPSYRIGPLSIVCTSFASPHLSPMVAKISPKTS